MLVIESGGTKSTWVIGKNATNTIQLKTVGLHPQELTNEKSKTIQNLINQHQLQNEIVYFYGAGCESNDARKKIHQFLTTSGANIIKDINTDLYIACLAHLGNEPGFVGILGTGAIVAQFDGNEVIKKTSGLGYILGDEGSGFDIGKRLLIAYFNEILPNNIKEEVNTYFHQKPILHRIYAPDGRLKIAGLTKIIKEWKDTIPIQEILNDAFTAFCKTGLEPLSIHSPIHFVGSIAHHFEKELKITITKHGYQVGKILQNASFEAFKHLSTKINH